MTAPQPALHRGIVKQVLSGDSVVIRDQPKGGPPPERTVGLSNIVAPKLARRPTNPGDAETKDEPWAWEAREYLRKKIIGKEVVFHVEYKVPGTGKEVGVIYLGKDTTGENVTESLVAEGLVEVRRSSIRATDEGQQRLIQLEDAAKAAGKGKWGPNEENLQHIREITWTIENPRHFVDSQHNKPINAVIEHVRDGCTVRAFLLPSFHYVTVMLSGIKAPMFKNEDGKQVPEPFAEEAKFFTECRLLQRDIQIILEGVSNNNLLGTVLHPNGNIAEFLLREGYARCVDWSMGVVSQGPEKLRSAEKEAKEKKLRIWKDYEPSGPSINIKDKSFTGKVVEVINGDGLQVMLSDGTVKKIFLASIRPPRASDSPTVEEVKKTGKSRPRPLYDVPYMFEAREFLRKKLIGKKVNVLIDYIQPESPEYPEKTCCTVTISNINVAEALVSKGLASVVRYRQDDDQRSSQYDLLLAAESRAQKKGSGIHSKKEPPMLRVADIAGDVAKSKQFFPFLQRAGKCQALVEFVASGSRLRLYIPKETCLITFLLSGIECPRGSRPDPARPGHMIPGDDFGDEATRFTRETVLQHEVEVEVEAMDKGGNFIGWLYIDGVNLSVALVENGLSKSHFTAERTIHYPALQRAEEKAKGLKLKIWSKHVEPKEESVVLENEPVERKVNYKTVVITEVDDALKFFVQDCETGPQLEKLMEQLRIDFTNSPPVVGSYTPKKGDLIAAKFVEDNQWYRGRVEKILPGNKAQVLFVDYGNREVTDTTRLATLPASYHSLPPVAREYCLALTQLPPDEDQILDAVDAFRQEVVNRQCLLNVEYKRDANDYVTLLYADNKEDVAQGLISDGWLLAELRKEKRLAKLSNQYKAAQDKAKSARLNLWRYGDFTEDDAKEFGFKQ